VTAKKDFYGKTAVIVGYEIEDSSDENHYLAFGLDEELPKGLEAPEYVSRVREHGGLGIIAHPDEIRNAIPQYPSYPWKAWGVDGFDGIEIWNHMSAWMELLKKKNVIKMIFTPRRGLRGPTDKSLKSGMSFYQLRNVLVLVRRTFHAHAFRKGPIKLIIFPYKVQFRSIRTHLLLDEDLSRDIISPRAKFYRQLRGADIRFKLSLGDASGFKFQVHSNDKIIFIGRRNNLIRK